MHAHRQLLQLYHIGHQKAPYAHLGALGLVRVCWVLAQGAGTDSSNGFLLTVEDKAIEDKAANENLTID